MKKSAEAWSFGKEKTRIISKTSNLSSPGPGSYNLTPLINGKGRVFNSKFHSSPGKTMSGRFSVDKKFISKNYF